MADISSDIRKIENAIGGETVRDAIIHALETLATGGSATSLNNVAANQFVTKTEFNQVFPLLDHIDPDSTKGVESRAINTELEALSNAIDNFITRKGGGNANTGDNAIAKIDYAKEKIDDICSAIRNAGGSLRPDAPLADYPEAISDLIRDLSSGTGTNYTIDGNKKITENGTYAADEGKAWRNVEVEVKPKLTSKKIDQLDSSGKAEIKIKDEEPYDDSDPNNKKYYYGYDSVSVDASSQLVDLNIDYSTIQPTNDSPGYPTPSDLAKPFKASDVVLDSSGGTDVHAIGFKEVTVDITNTLHELNIDLDPTAWEEKTYDPTASDEDDRGISASGIIYGYSKVHIKIVEAQGPFVVEFWNGSTLLQRLDGDNRVPKNGTAKFTGTKPTKKGYVWTGWNPSPTNITSGTESNPFKCYAQFEKEEDYRPPVGSNGKVNSSIDDIINGGSENIPEGSWMPVTLKSFTYNRVTYPDMDLYVVKLSGGASGRSIWGTATPITGWFPYFNYDNRMIYDRRLDILDYESSDLAEVINNFRLIGYDSEGNEVEIPNNGMGAYTVGFRNTASRTKNGATSNPVERMMPLSRCMFSFKELNTSLEYESIPETPYLYEPKGRPTIGNFTVPSGGYIQTRTAKEWSADVAYYETVTINGVTIQQLRSPSFTHDQLVAMGFTGDAGDAVWEYLTNVTLGGGTTVVLKYIEEHVYNAVKADIQQYTSTGTYQLAGSPTVMGMLREWVTSDNQYGFTNIYFEFIL